jgi:hypothetical protein
MIPIGILFMTLSKRSLLERFKLFPKRSSLISIWISKDRISSSLRGF